MSIYFKFNLINFNINFFANKLYTFKKIILIFLYGYKNKNTSLYAICFMVVYIILIS